MLVGNGVRAGGNPQRWLFGAGALNVNRPQWAQRGARYNFQAGDATVIGGAGIASKAAFPNGYLPPAAWQLPVEPGGIGATGGQLAGDAELLANLAGGLNATADLTGTSTLEATGGLIVQAAADLIGSGTLSADGVAVASMIAALAGAGEVSAALGALADLVADLTGTGTLAAAQTAIGNIGADIESCSGLTAGAVADAVWEALASAHTTLGTMGAALNAAGTAADPWGTLLPGAYGAGTAGEIVGNLPSAIEIATQLLDGDPIEVDGLDEMTMRNMLRVIGAAVAGKLSGAASTNVEIRDVLDHVTRIDATVDADGNRTAVTLDVSD